MPFSPSARQLARVVSRLRSAGCVFAEDEAQLLVSVAATAEDLESMTARRAGGLPLEQVVGWAEFGGLRIVVDPGVFVPRRRSEFLVRQAAMLGRSLAGATGRPCVLLDMCCGSGAVGMAVAASLGAAELHAVDVDPVAVTCARRNMTNVGQVYQGDLYQPLPATLRGKVDILVANAPYVPTGEIPLLPAEARLHEARVALDGGADGIDVHRRVAAGAPDWLSKRGYLLIETSERQATLTADAVDDAGMAAEVVTDEDWAAAVVIGSRA